MTRWLSSPLARNRECHRRCLPAEHSAELAEPQRALSLLTMIADNEKNYRAKRNHYVEACLIILGIEKVEPRRCPCGIRECAAGKIWAAPAEPAEGSGAAQAIGNPAEPIVLKPRPFHEMFLLPSATVAEGAAAADTDERPQPPAFP